MIATIVQLHLLDHSTHDLDDDLEVDPQSQVLEVNYSSPDLEVRHSSPDLKDDLKFDLLSSDQLLGNKLIQVNLRL